MGKEASQMSGFALAQHHQLFPTEVSGSTTFQWLSITSIVHQSDLAKSPILLQELQSYSHQLVEDGFHSAIVVKQVGTAQYEIVLGSKLYFAANFAGQEKIPAIVLSNNNSSRTEEIIRTKLDWASLNEIETAKAYDLFLTVFNYTHDELASLLRLSRPVITNQLRILQLPIEIQQLLQKKKITKSQCYLLLRLSSATEQIAFAKKIIQENLTVRQIEAQLAPPAHKKKKRQRELYQKLKKHFKQPLHLDVDKGVLSFSCASEQELIQLVERLTTKDIS